MIGADEEPTRREGSSNPLLGTQVVQELSSNVVVVEKLTSFQHKDKNMRDHGENVRHRAKQLSELIMDPDRVRAERKKVRGSCVCGRWPASGDETEDLGPAKSREINVCAIEMCLHTWHACGRCGAPSWFISCSGFCIVGGQSALHLTRTPRLSGRRNPILDDDMLSFIVGITLKLMSDALCTRTHSMQRAACAHSSRKKLCAAIPTMWLHRTGNYI